MSAFLYKRLHRGSGTGDSRREGSWAGVASEGRRRSCGSSTAVPMGYGRKMWISQDDARPATGRERDRSARWRRRLRQALLPAVAALALAAGPAAAQHEVPDRGGRVYGLVGGAFGDGTFVATGAGAGLRLTRHVGLDLELTHLAGGNGAGGGAPWFGGVSVFSAATSLAGADPEDYPPPGIVGDDLFATIGIENHGRDVTTFLTKLTVEFPIADGLLFPYFTGGGGVGRVTERYGFFVEPIPWIPWEDDPGAGHGIGVGGFFPDPGAYSELGLALVLGGGVDVRVWRGFGVGVDLRWLRVLRSYDALDTAQVAARASYRF